MMPCPHCKGKTKVFDTRLNPDNNVRRRRRCMKCGYRFSTIETEKLKQDKKTGEWTGSINNVMKEGYQRSAKENAKVAEEMGKLEVGDEEYG